MLHRTTALVGLAIVGVGLAAAAAALAVAPEARRAAVHQARAAARAARRRMIGLYEDIEDVLAARRGEAGDGQVEPASVGPAQDVDPPGEAAPGR